MNNSYTNIKCIHGLNNKYKVVFLNVLCIILYTVTYFLTVHSVRRRAADMQQDLQVWRAGLLHRGQQRLCGGQREPAWFRSLLRGGAAACHAPVGGWKGLPPGADHRLPSRVRWPPQDHQSGQQTSHGKFMDFVTGWQNMVNLISTKPASRLLTVTDIVASLQDSRLQTVNLLILLLIYSFYLKKKKSLMFSQIKITTYTIYLSQTSLPSNWSGVPRYVVFSGIRQIK